MDKKQRFSFLLRPEEKLALQELARATGRNQSVTLRRLIRQAAREHADHLASLQQQKRNSK